MKCNKGKLHSTRRTKSKSSRKSPDYLGGAWGVLELTTPAPHHEGVSVGGLLADVDKVPGWRRKGVKRRRPEG